MPKVVPRLLRELFRETATPRLGIALLCAFTLAGCVQVPDAESSGPFQPGRWESEDGLYFLELAGDSTEAHGVLPRDPSRTLGFACDGKWPPPAEIQARWSLRESEMERGVVSLSLAPDYDRSTGLAFIEPGNWAILEYYPCGVDSWPPLWLVLVDDE